MPPEISCHISLEPLEGSLASKEPENEHLNSLRSQLDLKVKAEKIKDGYKDAHKEAKRKYFGGDRYEQFTLPVPERSGRFNQFNFKEFRFRKLNSRSDAQAVSFSYIFRALFILCTN